jgi:hypothetical protein
MEVIKEAVLDVSQMNANVDCDYMCVECQQVG